MNEQHKQSDHQQGLLLVYTGEGKGKTTAALGIALRAAGQGMKVKIFQFIKSPERTTGEKLAMARLGVDMEQLGIGFTWTKTAEEHRDSLRKAWQRVKPCLQDPSIDVLILDELNNALAIDAFPIDDVLPLTEVLTTLQQRPPHMHVVVTGRNAHPQLIEIADLVSVIQAEKHYYDRGIAAVKGLEL